MTFTRRDFIRTAAVVGAVAIAGCGTRAEPPGTDVYVPNEPDYKGWLDGVSNYVGTVDRRGEAAVTVRVGTQGDTGYYKFDPPAVAVSPGAVVTWEWTGMGGTHNVVAESGAFDSGPLVSKAGHTFDHTFESPGVYTYVCEPHRTLGMKGAVFVALGDNGT